MEQVNPKNDLVMYCVPDQETHRELEEMADSCWRVFTGDTWKFYLLTRERARKYCKQMGGTHIGLAHWNEQMKANTYSNVEDLREESVKS